MNFLRLSLLSAFAAFVIGCTHERHITDSRHPEIAVSAYGDVSWRGNKCLPEDLPGLLESSDFPKTSTVNIRIDEKLEDMRVPRRIMGLLAQNGYRRSVLQKERKAYSGTVPKKDKKENSGKVNGK